MYGTFWALVPPILAIVLALITKEAYSSLFIGVVVGALFVANFSPVGALNALITDSDNPGGMIAAVLSNAGIFIFLDAFVINHFKHIYHRFCGNVCLCC